MNDPKKKVNIDSVSFKLIYQRNKDLLISVVAIFLSIFLIFQFVIPQIQELQAMQEEEVAVKGRIEVLNYNFQFFNQMDSQVLDENFLTASSALPLQKDFAGILQGISQAAGGSGVGLDDFAFRVGDLSTPSGKLVSSKRPLIEIELTIRGDIIKAKGFVKKLSETLPLSDIGIVQNSGVSSTILTNFYYRPFPPVITFDDKVKSKDLTPSEKELLSKLNEWRASAALIPVTTQSINQTVVANNASSSSQVAQTVIPTSTVAPIQVLTPTPTLSQ